MQNILQVDNILSQKTSLRKFKKTEIMPSIFSNDNSLILEINEEENFKKFTNM